MWLDKTGSVPILSHTTYPRTDTELRNYSIYTWSQTIRYPNYAQHQYDCSNPSSNTIFPPGCMPVSSQIVISMSLAMGRFRVQHPLSSQTPSTAIINAALLRVVVERAAPFKDSLQQTLRRGRNCVAELGDFTTKTFVIQPVPKELQQ
jgi:DNA-directed RNA polymerase subunit L